MRAVAPSINAETISTYVGLLERMFVVEAQQSWTPALRSRARLRTTAKLHLADPALAAAALGAGARQLRGDLTTLGLLFESAVVHDLAVYVGALGGEVRHYRDSNGKEIDAIVTLPDGRWAAVEVKLGGPQMSAGARALGDALKRIDTEAVGEPALRLVVTGTVPILTLDDAPSPVHSGRSRPERPRCDRSAGVVPGERRQRLMCGHEPQSVSGSCYGVAAVSRSRAP